MDTTSFLIFLAIIVAIVGAVVYFGFLRKRIFRLAIEIPNLPYQFTTPRGVRVRSTVPVPDSALSTIDAGIMRQLVRASAAHPDWSSYAVLSDYDVMFIDPQATNQINYPGSPAIVVHGIQAAGTCIGLGDGYIKPTIVLPHQAASGWTFMEYLAESARNESEHVRLWNNDLQLFGFYTGTNDIHPIFP